MEKNNFLNKKYNDNEYGYYKYDLSKHKQFDRLVKHIMMFVRKSLVYDKWQKMTKYNVNECPICGIDISEVKFDTHHYPKTLYEIVEEHLSDLVENNLLDEKTDLDIAEEILNNHFLGLYSYVVLCEYCHKKYHDEVPEVLQVIDEKWREQKEFREKFFKENNIKLKES
jgi:hypothetical protein